MYSVVCPDGDVWDGFDTEADADLWIRDQAEYSGLHIIRVIDNASTPFIDYILCNNDIYSIKLPE